ncbi:MAG TPA: protein kinase [Kofleriaceae bacterium]|jgi:serine/threonine-protein kinase
MTELPTTFGKYFLTEKLATGGMAEIYLAKLVGPGGFEKQLVIKQIHPKLSGQRHFVDLFVAEAKTLVTLAHGNIVPVYELGVIDDTYFIAMEYIDGPTLYRFTEILARRGVAMAPAIAAWIAARILEGLDYAHRKGEGVIHRDLSPRNVMLSRDGEVKLVDFGIAVTLGGGETEGAESAPTGSFPYMSPEQVRKEPLTGQTDLFSVGVLAWEMLAGQRLFARPEPEATLQAVLGAPIPPPSSVRPDVPAKLDEVVMRALERDAAARWPSAGEMLAALQRYLYALEETPGPRDIAALVARYTPPETRRIPTHADVLGDPEPDGTEVRAPGPSTAVIPRDAPARGRTRARTETFATSVAIAKILAPDAAPTTTVAPRTDEDAPTAAAPDDEPVAPDDERAAPDDEPAAPDDEPAAPDGEPAGAPEPDNVSRPPSTRRASRVSDTADPVPPEDDGNPLKIEIPGRKPPSTGGLILAGIGATVLAVSSIVMFMRERDSVNRPDAAPKFDAPSYATEPTPIDAPAALPDAPEPDAPLVDAGHAHDGGHVHLPPAFPDAPPALPDAPVAAPPPDAHPAAVKGTGTLRIGAIPWGDVVIDGVKRGRTPNDFVVPAGHHTVEVVFGGDEPPRTKPFSIDIAPGETRELQADFTKP